jgi:hypothetical protein
MAAFVRSITRRPVVLTAVAALLVIGGGLAAHASSIHHVTKVTIKHSPVPTVTASPSPIASHHPVTPVPTVAVNPGNCDVHIHNTNPDSRTEISCTSDNSGANSSVNSTSNNVSVSNVSNQSASGGSVHNSSSSSTTINISN